MGFRAVVRDENGEEGRQDEAKGRVGILLTGRRACALRSVVGRGGAERQRHAVCIDLSSMLGTSMFGWPTATQMPVEACKGMKARDADKKKGARGLTDDQMHDPWTGLGRGRYSGSPPGTAAQGEERV